MIKQVKMLLNKHTTGFRRILAMTVLILFALLMSAFITGSSVAGIIPSATIILAIFYYSSEILLKLRKMDGQFTYLISHQAHDIKDINYREIESLINLRHYIKLRHPIWGLRGFASSPDFLFHIYRIICERKPQTVLELGRACPKNVDFQAKPYGAWRLKSLRRAALEKKPPTSCIWMRIAARKALRSRSKAFSLRAKGKATPVFALLAKTFPWGLVRWPQAASACSLMS